MTSQRVKIALVGCGSISQFAHLPALVKADHVELVALCDASEDLLIEIGNRYGVSRLFTDYRALLDQADADAVVLAVADRLHVPLAIQALEVGKHVLVEKPLGTDAEDCRKLTPVVSRSRNVLQVGFMKRHDPGIQYARRFVREEMGERLSVSAWYCDSCRRYELQHTLLPPLVRAKTPVHPQSHAKADRQSYYLTTHGIHVIDTIQYLGGPIAAVRAAVAEKFDCYSWHCLLEFADGAVGDLELTVQVKDDWREGFVVHGENGSVSGRTFLPFFRRPSEVQVTDTRNDEVRTPIAPDSDPYERQLEAFARAILFDEPVLATAEDGLRDAEVLEAVRIATATGERVVVP